MKRIAVLLVTAVMVVSLAACGSSTSTGSSDSGSSNETIASASSDSSAKADVSGKKTLVVYFSASNGDTADTVSSATPKVGDAGATQYIAETIDKNVDSDIAKIVPKESYPADYNGTADQAKSEADSDARPEFTLDPDVNPEDYDVIFIGYPMWWYQMPMVMDTFFDTYDFSGKTIIPFNTHAGSGDGGTYDDIRKLEPDATVLDGLPIAGDDAGDSASEVKDWLAGLGY